MTAHKPFPSHAIQEEKVEKHSFLTEKQKYDIQEYLKVGLFCNWNWQDYQRTEQWVIDGISEEIDQRLAPYLEEMKTDNTGFDDGKPKTLPLNFFHLALLLSLAKLFGGED